MGLRAVGLTVGIATAALIAGAAVVGYGAYDGVNAKVKPPVAPTIGQSYTFVDPDRTPNAQSVSYRLPPLPAGAYSVSLFAGLEPKQQIADENLYCQIRDTTRTGASRILFVTAHWRDSAATGVSGASSVRLREDNAIWILCEAEHVKMTYAGDPLRVTFVRIPSLKSAVMTPE